MFHFVAQSTKGKKLTTNWETNRNARIKNREDRIILLRKKIDKLQEVIVDMERANQKDREKTPPAPKDKTLLATENNGGSIGL